MKLLVCLRVAILLGALFGASRTGGAEDPIPSGKDLADALVTVTVDEMKWIRGVALLPFAVEIGIPEDRFRESQPGAEFTSLPKPVLTALQRGTDALPAWRECLKDERLTGISENDLFGGGSSEKARKISCADAAATVVFAMVPMSEFKGLSRDRKANLPVYEAGATRWEARVRGMTPAERTKAWFEGANENERRRFLAVAIGLRNAAAYPLIETDFRERSRSPDVYLLMEYSAYVRHRRAAVKDFTGEFTASLRKAKWEGKDEGGQDFFFAMWKLLTEYDSLEPAVNRWRKGELDLQTLHTLLERSIDRPWAYHSMPLEPASAFRPTMEQNLRTLVAAAVEERDLEKRLQLLQMGGEASSLLMEVIGRVTDTEKRPLAACDAAEWKLMIIQLRELFRDQRPYDDGRSLNTPAHAAASIVYELWWPRGKGHDWRDDAIRFTEPSLRAISLALAEDMLAHPAGSEPQDYPEGEAATLTKSLVEGNAAAWRTQLASLRWDQRLLAQGEVEKNREFALRLWPRLMEFVEWSGATANEPASFAALWQNELAGRSIDEKTWKSLQDWLVAEARAQRYWTVIGESFPIRPGLTLYVLRTSSKDNEPEARQEDAVLRTNVGGGYSFYSQVERLRITADGVEEIAAAPNDGPPPGTPKPLEALRRQGTLTEKDRGRATNGFVLRMMVIPPQ